jgi:hypothetical protein
MINSQIFFHPQDSEDEPSFRSLVPCRPLQCKKQEKLSFCGFAEVKSKTNWVSKITKRFGPQITNMQIATFSEGPKIQQIWSASVQICNLRIFFADWPPKLTGTPDKLAGFEMI